MKRQVNWLMVAVLLASFLAACAPATPQVVEKEVVVEKPVVQTVVVEKQVVVEKEVPAVALEEAAYETYPPYGQPTMEILQPVSRLDTLAGKTICGVGTSFHGAETFPVIAEYLKKKYPDTTFVGQDVLNRNSCPQGAAWPDCLGDLVKQYKCDAVIVGNGC